MMLSVGIPKEVKPLEKRVGLIPSMAAKLTAEGIPVFVEQSAGLESGFSDAEYAAAGVIIVPGMADVYRRGDIILKVKEPQPEEFSLLRNGQILFCFLHLASPAQCELVSALLRNQVTAVGFETLEKDGRIPMLAPMSEIAGGLAAAYADYFSRFRVFSNVAKREELPLELLNVASSYPEYVAGEKQLNYVIYGGGIAGMSAAAILSKMNHRAVFVEEYEKRRVDLKGKGYQAYSPAEIPFGELSRADVLIGTAHARGRRAARVIQPDEFRRVSEFKPKIVMDVAIDQGGNFPASKPTVYEEPVFTDEYGNLRFCVTNMPSFCGRFASQKLSEACIDYVVTLSRFGEKAFETVRELESAVNIRRGCIVNEDVRAAHQRGSD